ncbi:hypothetical protein DDW11_02820 [Sulfolobus sp. SCGC AB-777_G06]|jgi:Fe2+ or Zn2+ uptake regulation protein|uniref:hypothetical protein n=1 Tax=Stygiolobus sp. CP850M TaxID=3133134 RepID=UPI000D573FCC|nr:hypothetical protein [Sulfolobaceae archaeon]PVU75453.1 hypothetical protein DDW11_02820 [Sulfolobus sp. SCGC AB-777_G06]
MNKDELREVILQILEEKKGEGLTSTEIRNILIEKGVEFNMIEFREVLADLVREGKVKKTPDYNVRKFKFSLP